jgi:hypothetical protein
MAPESSGNGSLARRPATIRVRPTLVSETRLRPATRPGPEPRPARTRVRVKVRSNTGSIRTPSGYQHVLMGEMIAAFVIIGIRAIADYTPASDTHNPGSETPKKGMSPIVLITATLGVFFVLSFLATRGGWPARTSAAFGLLMIVALMINSEAELAEVASWVENIGTNSASQPAAKQSSPTIAGGSGSSASNLPPGTTVDSSGHVSVNGKELGPDYGIDSQGHLTWRGLPVPFNASPLS